MDGKIISNDLKILDILGHGTSSDVYKCLYTKGELEKIVAVKLLKESYTNENNYHLSEIKNNSILNHPNICQIVDIGNSIDNQLYVIYEYLDGDLSLFSRTLF